MVSAKLYDGRLAVDIAGLKMQTPVTTASGTFGFGLEFTDFLDLEKVGYRFSGFGKSWGSMRKRHNASAARRQ